MLSIFLSRLQGALSSHCQSICIEVSIFGINVSQSWDINFLLLQICQVHTTSTVIYCHQHETWNLLRMLEVKPTDRMDNCDHGSNSWMLNGGIDNSL